MFLEYNNSTFNASTIPFVAKTSPVLDNNKVDTSLYNFHRVNKVMPAEK